MQPQAGRQASTRFTYPTGMEGWVDLGDWLWVVSQVVTGPCSGQSTRTVIFIAILFDSAENDICMADGAGQLLHYALYGFTIFWHQHTDYQGYLKQTRARLPHLILFLRTVPCETSNHSG